MHYSSMTRAGEFSGTFPLLILIFYCSHDGSCEVVYPREDSFFGIFSVKAGLKFGMFMFANGAVVVRSALSQA